MGVRLRIIILLLGLGLAIWWWKGRATEVAALQVVPVAVPVVAVQTPFVGESVLRDYAREGKTVREDLNAMHQLLANFQVLVKHPDALPLGANAEIAAALRGEGRHNREAFLPRNHAAFNTAGEFIDRWGSPLILHAESRDRVSIRSAGLDRVARTADDLTRGTDGVFRSGSGE